MRVAFDCQSCGGIPRHYTKPALGLRDKSHGVKNSLQNTAVCMLEVE